MFKKTIFDVIVSILDKLLPEVIKKFIPLIKVFPKEIDFYSDGEWLSNLDFYVYNRSNDILFDVYLLIDLNNLKTEDFKLYFKSNEDLDISFGILQTNYGILEICLTDKNKKDLILLKIFQINQLSNIHFRISSKSRAHIKFKILKYSKIQSIVSNKTDAVSLGFEIPIKDKNRSPFQLKSVSSLMRKGNGGNSDSHH